MTYLRWKLCNYFQIWSSPVWCAPRCWW